MYEVMSSMGLAEYLPKVIDFSSEYDANVMILERIQEKISQSDGDVAEVIRSG